MLSRIEISRENLIHNCTVLRSLLLPEQKLLAAIKANAYGHGMTQIVTCLENFVDGWQVDDAIEARELSNITKKPIFIFGYIAVHELSDIARDNVTIALYDTFRLSELNRLGAHVHIKIDACLGRQGVLLEEVPGFISELKKFSDIHVDGIYGHFANIEDVSDISHATKQLSAFSEAVALFNAAGYVNLNTHMSATSGVIRLGLRADHASVRFGIGLYGLWPSKDLQKEGEARGIFLKPILRWVSCVAQVKTVPAGYSIGYGLTYVTPKKMKIAIIPQGYSDGFARDLSNMGTVLIRGRRCAVIGRVSMNMFAVDVDHVSNVEQEDEVVLLGEQGDECISAEEIAEGRTINYEVTTRITPLLPRIVV